MDFFSIDGPLMRFLNLAANLFLLHVLWIIYSLPIFTIGASTTALYYTCMKQIRREEGYVFRNFHWSFKQNLKQSAIIWLVLSAIGFLFFTDIRYGIYLQNTIGKFMIAGCSLFLIPYLFILIYIFPIQAKFENKISDNIKNALLMAIRHFPFTLILIVILGSILFLSLFFRPFMGLILICGAGLTAYLTSNIYIQIFRNYLPDEIQKDLEHSGEKFR